MFLFLVYGFKYSASLLKTKRANLSSLIVFLKATLCKELVFQYNVWPCLGLEHVTSLLAIAVLSF